MPSGFPASETWCCTLSRNIPSSLQIHCLQIIALHFPCLCLLPISSHAYLILLLNGEVQMRYQGDAVNKEPGDAVFRRAPFRVGLCFGRCWVCSTVLEFCFSQMKVWKQISALHKFKQPSLASLSHVADVKTRIPPTSIPPPPPLGGGSSSHGVKGGQEAPRLPFPGHLALQASQELCHFILQPPWRVVGW